ncbi:MAG: alpha-galactosidase [Kiritimatiellae bacterium]|nr:alpha-galactosidase [Kiritimatiellia bacterium]
MTKKLIMGALMLATTSLGANEIERIHIVPCPKCDKRMRILDGNKEANVNICRLQDDSPDEETLARRVDAMRARAERFLSIANKKVEPNKLSPLMGWSTWNTFAVDISEDIIVDTAANMATNGLKEAGYVYVNIDDGFFCGHDEKTGRLKIHPRRFPNGLKSVVDKIHALGMKAGIYSDAGRDTCGSSYSGDKSGLGSGLYGHDKQDCELFFRDCDFDFIKVDYCGGTWLNLEEKKRYTEISRAIYAAAGGKDIRFNICRWKFPGTWAAEIADSWRTTRDIRANWKIVRQIISENLYLSAFASPGKFNDMDMLEVGHIVGETKTKFLAEGDTGLTREEEKTHFGMWCMLSSPLLLGCDARNMNPETMELVTNPFLVEMNQNGGLGLQGYIVSRNGDGYVLVKDAFERFGKSRYVALYNAGDEPVDLLVDSRELDLGGRIQAFDLMERADVGEFENKISISLAPHAAKFYLFDAEERLERKVYEAECAYLKAYQELRDAKKVGTAYHARKESAHGAVVVDNLGGNEENYLEWKDVYLFEDGEREFKLTVFSNSESRFILEIDGEKINGFSLEAKEGAQEIFFKAELEKGSHSIKICNPESLCPQIDRLEIIS